MYHPTGAGTRTCFAVQQRVPSLAEFECVLQRARGRRGWEVWEWTALAVLPLAPAPKPSAEFVRSGHPIPGHSAFGKVRGPSHRDRPVCEARPCAPPRLSSEPPPSIRSCAGIHGSGKEPS
jgi:hypothetical protein